MITAEYLGEIANYTNDQIDRVVLNGNVKITDFTVKRVSDQLLEMEYMVRTSDVDNIERIETRTAAGHVISSNNVYVPIISDTIIKQHITVKGA